MLVHFPLFPSLIMIQIFLTDRFWSVSAYSSSQPCRVSLAPLCVKHSVFRASTEIAWPNQYHSYVVVCVTPRLPQGLSRVFNNLANSRTDNYSSRWTKSYFYHFLLVSVPSCCTWYKVSCHVIVFSVVHLDWRITKAIPDWFCNRL